MKLKYSSVINILIWIHILMWILIIPVTEFQLILFGKKIVTLYTLGIIEFIVFVILSLRFIKNPIKLNPVTKNCLIYVCMMILFWFFGFMANPDTPIYWKFYYIFYWIMPLLIVIISSQVNFNYKLLLKVITIIALINAIMVLMQHYSNSLIWPYEVDDQGKTLFYISSNYYNTNSMIRCPGLCMSGLDSGSLMIFGFLTIYLDKSLKIWKKFFLLAFLTYSIWFTGTRNIYLLLAFILGFIAIYKFVKEQNRTAVSISYTVFSSITSVFLQLNLGSITQIATRDLITDFTSMNARFIIWEKIIYDFDKGTIFQKIIGKSVWQSAGYNMIIDNMYFELLIMIGIVGVLYFCFFLGRLSLLCFKNDVGNYTLYTSFLLGLFVYGTLNVLGSLNLTFIMVIAIVISRNIGGECSES